MARRTFENLKTEHIRRVGRVGDTAYAAIAEEHIKAAYFDLATNWFHHELAAIETGTPMSVASNTVVLPADAHVAIQVVLRSTAAGNAPIKALDYHEARYQFALYTSIQGEPKAYTRFGASLYTDKKADVAYPLSIYYQKKPAEPVFSGAPASLLAVQWDEVLLNLSVAIGLESLWRPDLAGAAQARADKFFSDVPQVRLRDLVLHGQPETPTRGRPLGGPVG